MTTSSEQAPCAMVPGNHDGVHVGHRALIQRAREHAQAHGLRVRALTFDPHPAVVLAPERAPTPLTTIARRRELLRAAGVDEVVVQPFTREFANQTAEAFLDRLVARGARALVVGPDFRFGHGREGDLDALRAFGAAHALTVFVEDPVVLDGTRVSSSAVREALRAGEVGHAARLLGRWHDVGGRVVVGHRRGHTLGFPTANLAPEPVLLPADGVYAVVARVPGASSLVDGVANLGVRPTFAAGRALEVHLFDHAGDLYDAALRVGFVKRLRGEQRFDSIDALKAQIARDVTAAREALASAARENAAWI